MIKDFDKLISNEIYFDKLRIKYGGSFFEKVYERVVEMKKTKSVKEIKKYIKSLDFKKKLISELENLHLKQYELLNDEPEKSKETKIGILSALALNGNSYKKFAKKRDYENKKLLINLTSDFFKFPKDFYIKKFRRDNLSYFKTLLKEGREQIYDIIEKRIPPSEKTGWISIAVLDSITSQLCLGLHKRFYSFAYYDSRIAIPNRPPRHIKCRSILKLIRRGDNRDKYVKETAESFLKRNPKIAKDVLGKKKYDLLKNNDYVMIFDKKNGRLFTNKQIEKRIKKEH